MSQTCQLYDHTDFGNIAAVDADISEHITDIR